MRPVPAEGISSEEMAHHPVVFDAAVNAAGKQIPMSNTTLGIEYDMSLTAVL